MQFQTLNKIEQLDQIDRASAGRPQLLFKHSTRCSVSRMALKSLTAEMQTTDISAFDIYYLDLLEHRSVSNEIAERYKVRHESPQLLVIKNGSCVYHASHSDVSLADAAKALL